jgi:hypothetical protein
MFIILVEKIYKMQHLEGSGTPVLYIGRTVCKGYCSIGKKSLFVLRSTQNT